MLQWLKSTAGLIAIGRQAIRTTSCIAICGSMCGSQESIEKGREWARVC